MFLQGRCAVILTLLLLTSSPIAVIVRGSEPRELERLMKQLGSPVPSQKVQAAAQLAHLGTEAASATDQLMVCLEDSDPDVRLYAAHALAHVSTDLAPTLSSLVDVLADRDEHVRYAAEWAIVYLAKSIGAEKKLSQSESAALLVTLNGALQQFSKQEHQPRHAKAVKQAIDTLNQLAQKTTPMPVAQPNQAGLIAIQRAAEVDALKLQFRTGQRAQLFNLVEQLHASPLLSPEVIKQLLVCVFESADSRLAKFAVKRWEPASQVAMEDILAELSDRSLPQWANLLLSSMIPQNQKVVSRLILIANSPSTLVDVRTAAISAIGNSQIQADVIRIALTDLVCDASADEQVRVAAVTALAQLGELPGGLQKRVLLVFTQPDETHWLRDELAQHLHRLAPRSSDAVVALAQLLSQTDSQDAAYAELAIALGKFGPAGVVGLQALIAGLSSTDDYITEACVQGLKGLGPAAAPATPALVALVANPQVLVSTKSEAAIVLRTIGTPAVEQLVERLPDSLTTTREHLLHVLAIIGPEARAATAVCLERIADATESRRVRVAAIIALGAIGPASELAVPVLEQLIATDQFSEVRAAAVIALAQINPAAATAVIATREHENDFAVRLSLAFAKHITGQSVASFRSLLTLLDEGDSENNYAVENTLLDLGHVALPLLMSTIRDHRATPVQRTVCMQVAARMPPVDWPPLIEMLADDPLSADFASALLSSWEFDDTLLPQLLKAMQQPLNDVAKAHLNRMVEYLTSELGAGGGEEQWTGGFTITRYVDELARQATAGEGEKEMASSAMSPPRSSSQRLGLLYKDQPLIPESAETAAPQAATVSDLKQVKVYYGTNRQPLDVPGVSLSGGSKTTFAASIGLAIAACATCAFGFLRRKAPAYALAALAGLGSVSTLAVHSLSSRTPLESALEQARYGGDYSATVELGMCEVSIPEIHRPGELESPSLLLRLEVAPDPNKHIVLKKVQRLEPDAFYNDLQAELASRGNNILVFVHGYNVSFEDAARRTAQMSYDLKFPGAPIFYSWPSQANWYRYRTDRENIERSVAQIKDFLIELADRSEGTTINLVAHSMGNVGLTAALSAMDGQAQFNQIVLAAPDIDAQTFKDTIAPRIVTRGKRVTLYTSKTDLALIASRYFNHGARAGDSGNEMVYVPGIETIDATAVDSSLLGHSYYGSNVSVLYDLGQLLSGQPIAARTYLQPSTNPYMPSWYFDPKNIASQPRSTIVPLRR